MDAYPTLTYERHPSISSLCYGWEGYLEKLKALSERWGKPLVITEIGTRSVEGGAQNPWDWQRQGPVDLTVQRKCYEAALRMVAGRTWLAGMYWWQWSPDPADGGPNDDGYSPRGKPAENSLHLGPENFRDTIPFREKRVMSRIFRIVALNFQRKNLESV